MCKNANNPCPGCKRHNKADVVWMFFTDEERQAAEASTTASSHVDAHS